MDRVLCAYGLSFSCAPLFPGIRVSHTHFLRVRWRHIRFLLLSDILHHHLSLAVLLIWAGHMYSSVFSSVDTKSRYTGVSYGLPLWALFGPYKSLELELSIALIAVSTSSSFTAQHIYSISPYIYLTSDYVTTVALFSHHMWVSSLCRVGFLCPCYYICHSRLQVGWLR